MLRKNTDRDARIVEAFIQGARPRDLATAHGVSEPRIYQIIKASRPSRPSPDEIRIGAADGAA